MTAENPSVRLSEQDRDLLELFAWGVLDPLPGYLSEADHQAVRQQGRLADGTPWHWSWTLGTDCAELDDPTCVTLLEPEGQPVGSVEVTGTRREGGRLFLSGPVRLERAPVTGPFRSLRHAPSSLDGAAVERVALLVEGALEPEALLGALDTARASGAPLLLLPTVGNDGNAGAAAAVAAVRSCHAAQAHFGERVEIAALPLPPGGLQDTGRAWLTARAARRFGVGTLLVPAAGTLPRLADEAGTARILPCPRGTQADAALRRSLDAVREAASPPAHRAGLVVLFTGLPSAGKSTLARGLRDALLGETERTVTLLDGDVVRATLSADLSFSRADRLRNLSRLATVSAECARHGGVVLCAPVAPHEQGRQEFRRIVSGAANLLLVHVATPVGECSRRDAKGLYAAAAAGRLTGLTGVDDAYEPPSDPDLTVGGNGEDRDASVRLVLDELLARGWIRPGGWGAVR